MFKNNQTGAALFTALIFLLILTLVGLTALRNSGLSERMSTNAQISQMAFNAAESAANRYKAEYNYNVQVIAPVGEASDRNDRLKQYLPVISLTPQSYFEYCLDNNSSVLTAYQDASGDTIFNTPADCSGRYLDDAVGVTTPVVVAKNKVIYENCGKLLSACPGYSGDGDIQCHVFKMEAEGTVAETTAYTDQWVSVLGACIN